LSHLLESSTKLFFFFFFFFFFYYKVSWLQGEDRKISGATQKIHHVAAAALPASLYQQP